MTDLEIPLVSERGWRYRFFEILPGFLTWSILALPFILSQISPKLTIIFIIGFLLLWFAKSIGLDVRAIQGYKTMKQHEKLPWADYLRDLDALDIEHLTAQAPAWHRVNVQRLLNKPPLVTPSQLLHAVIVATYKESREVLEPTIKAVLASDYDMKKVIFILAYEERGGVATADQAHELIETYGDQFLMAAAIGHPMLPGEITGKGGNITFAGRKLKTMLEDRQIDPKTVVVTTLDADNRPHPQYLNSLGYLFVAAPDPIKVSFQPIPMFTNNIWDAPAPMRVIATGNSFWMTVTTMRPHMLRNFSSHAQSMQALIDTDFWSVRTIVEDGHQFWRTYFRYDGQHEVYPIYLPIYQDAVLSNTYLKTLRAQFVQLRRWAWGATDIAYVAEKGFFTPNKVPKMDLVFKFLRLLEGHISWATAPLILAFSSFIPLLLNPQDYAANQLPQIASRIETLALIGIFVTMFFSLKTLPPKPERYKRHRSIFMIIQWVYLPVTTVLYNSLSALYAQTRLMFGLYIGKFDVTDKAVVTAEKKKIL